MKRQTTKAHNFGTQGGEAAALPISADGVVGRLGGRLGVLECCACESVDKGRQQGGRTLGYKKRTHCQLLSDYFHTVKLYVKCDRRLAVFHSEFT